MMRPALFLDRDGTINVEVNYLHQPEQVELEQRVGEAIALANTRGWLVVVVTNQSGIARGYYDLAAMHAVHQRISELLQAWQAQIDGWYWCPHHPDFTGVCACRKPNPALLHQAAQQCRIDLARSWMIGDKISDVQAGLKVGCRAILVRTGYGSTDQAQVPAGVPVVDTLFDAVEHAGRP